MRAAAEEGRDARRRDRRPVQLPPVPRVCLSWAQVWQGDLAAGAALIKSNGGRGSEAAHDLTHQGARPLGQGFVLAYQGDFRGFRGLRDLRGRVRTRLGLRGHRLFHIGFRRAPGRRRCEIGVGRLRGGVAVPWCRATNGGHAASTQRPGRAGRWGPGRGPPLGRRAVSTASGWNLVTALTTRARVGIAQGEPERAERDAHDALACAAETGVRLGISDTLECLATVAADAGSHREAARLFGAAAAIRQRMGVVRFKVWDADHVAWVAELRNAMSQEDFEGAWAEGAALSTEEAIAYAQRGRGERKRPTSGWASLTPAELDVVRLVSEGLGNNDIAARLLCHRAPCSPT